jgi:hypothetical protein
MRTILVVKNTTHLEEIARKDDCKEAVMPLPDGVNIWGNAVTLQQKDIFQDIDRVLMMEKYTPRVYADFELLEQMASLKKVLRKVGVLLPCTQKTRRFL